MEIKKEWIIGGIIILLLIVLFFPMPGESGNSCTQDSDCVKVQSGCCPCNMGGEKICVPKDQEQSYLDKIANCSSTTICAAVDNCKVTSCQCNNGECTENEN